MNRFNIGDMVKGSCIAGTSGPLRVIGMQASGEGIIYRTDDGAEFRESQLEHAIGKHPTIRQIQALNLESAERYVPSSVPYLRAAYDVTKTLEYRFWAMAEARIHTINMLAHRLQEDPTKFWRQVYPEGMTAEQIKAELTDFHYLMGEAAKVYMAVTGGRISKTNTEASAVIAEFEANFIPKEDAKLWLFIEGDHPTITQGLDGQHELAEETTDEEITTAFKVIYDAAEPLVKLLKEFDDAVEGGDPGTVIAVPAGNLRSLVFALFGTPDQKAAVT